jgi:hypothetical protein
MYKRKGGGKVIDGEEARDPDKETKGTCGWADGGEGDRSSTLGHFRGGGITFLQPKKLLPVMK